MRHELARLKDTVMAYRRAFVAAWGVPRPPSQARRDRRLLLLASEFAPAITGGVYRPAALARYASAQGWDVTVVCNPPPAQPPAAGLRLLEYVGPRVRILRTQPIALVPSYRLFPDLDGGLLGAVAIVEAACHAFGDDLPRTILASGPNFNTFVAGRLLSRGPGVRLFLEYRDEWSLCPFDFVSTGGSNRRWERWCLAGADATIFTTEAQRQHHETMFGTNATARRWVLPNGWEPEEASADPGNARSPSGRRVITFAGKLGGHTDPAPFLRALSQILDARADLRQRLLFRFVGAKHAHAVELLRAFPYQQNVESVPVVSQPVAARLMRESDALLLVHDPRFARYLPGKLYEYIASKRPIILFDDQGESSELVKQLGVGWSVSSADRSQFESVLDRICFDDAGLKWPERDVNVNVDSWLMAHTRQRLSERTLSLLEDTELRAESSEKTLNIC